MQTRHESYQHAASSAWKHGQLEIQIVASLSNPQEGRFKKEAVFFLESGDDMTMIRNWERLCYSGPANGAPTSDPSLV